MYEVCKTAMPQILSNLPTNQPNMYSNANLAMFSPYGFNSFSKPDYVSNPSDYSRMVSNNMPKYPSEASSFAKIGFPPGNPSNITGNIVNKNFIVEQPRM